MKKRILSFFLAALMVVSCFGILAVSADTPAVPTLTVSSGRPNANGEVSVDVRLSNNTGIAGIVFGVKFNKEHLNVISAEKKLFGDSDVAVLNIEDPNVGDLADLDVVTYTYHQADNFTNAGTVLTIKFKVVGEFELTEISIVDADVVDKVYGEISVDTVAGKISTKAAGQLKADAATIKSMAPRADGNFAPNEPATRYEVLAALYNIVDIDAFANPFVFTDVDDGNKALVDAFTQGCIVNGYDNGDGTYEFRGNNSITRAEVAVLVSKLFSLDTVNAPDAGFTDVPDWAKKEINACAAAEYVKGVDVGIYNASGKMTRAQLASLIVNITDAVVDTDAKVAFGDVIPDTWYYSQVATVTSSVTMKDGAADIKYFPGYEDGTFKPMQGATRYEVVVAMNNLFDIELVANADAVEFTDLDDVDAETQEIVRKFAAAGIINGFDQGDGTYKFDGNGTITRAQIALLMAKVTGLNRATAPSAPFTDVPNGFWAKSAIDACYKAEFVKGTDAEGTTFAPHASITRAQLATLLNNVAGKNTKDIQAEDVDCNYTDITDKNAWYYVEVAVAAIPYVAPAE